MSNLISTVGDGQQTNHDQIPDFHRPPCQVPCHGDSVSLLNDSGADNSSCNGLVVVVKVVEKSNKTGSFHHSDKNSKSCQSIWCFFFSMKCHARSTIMKTKKIMSSLYFLQAYIFLETLSLPYSRILLSSPGRVSAYFLGPGYYLNPFFRYTLYISKLRLEYFMQILLTMLPSP